MEKRKLHQVIKNLSDRDKYVAKMLEDLHKELGIVSDTEIVRYCINKTYKSIFKTSESKKDSTPKREICPRCKGEGKIKVIETGTILSCGRCNGSGKLSHNQ